MEMRLTKAEKIILILTIIFVVFAVGYRFGSHRGASPMEISTVEKLYEGVDINSADVETLTTLPGLGELVAGEIVSYREEHGGFTTVEELLNVPGMNKELYEMIKDAVSVK